MRKIGLFFLFLCSFSLHLFAAEPPVPIAIDTTKVMWVENGTASEHFRTVYVGLKEVKDVTTLVVDQWDDGATFPQEFYVTDFAKGYFTTLVDMEYDTKFVLTVFNNYGNTQTEFILHPKDITKTITLGVGEVVMPKDDAATVYSVGGRIVWRGSLSEVEQALRGLPRGIYIVKSGRTTKKVSVKP